MSRRRKPQAEARPWQPMRQGHVMPRDREFDMTEDEARAVLVANDNAEVWKNDRYTVHVERYEDICMCGAPDLDAVHMPIGGEHSFVGAVCELSIKRNDRKPAHDWRHFQRIKNDIAGPEIEAIELYPAMSRLVDTANQYWLWCARPGTSLEIGFAHGAVRDGEFPGAKQRALDADWRPTPEETTT